MYHGGPWVRRISLVFCLNFYRSYAILKSDAKMPPRLFFVPPMECKEVKSARELPRTDDWQYEVKFDANSRDVSDLARLLAGP